MNPKLLSALGLTDYDAEVLEQLGSTRPDLFAIFEAKLRFFEDDQTGAGIISPTMTWDVLPPGLLYRERVWLEGKRHIRGLTPETRATLPDLPEGVWAILEGGRALILPETLRWETRIADKRVTNGFLENALIQGRSGDPLTVAKSAFEKCIFVHCMFRNLAFEEVDFLSSRFQQCTFQDCTFTRCHFAHTTWGDPDDMAWGLHNFLQGTVTTTECDFAHSRGFGLAVFIPEYLRPVVERVRQEYFEDRIIVVDGVRKREPKRSAKKSMWWGHQLLAKLHGNHGAEG